MEEDDDRHSAERLRVDEERRILEERGLVSGFCAGRASINRTPPQGFGLPVIPGDCFGTQPSRQESSPCYCTPPTAAKRTLTSPEEVQEACKRRAGASSGKSLKPEAPPLGGILTGTQLVTQRPPNETVEPSKQTDDGDLHNLKVDVLHGLSAAHTRGILEAIKSRSSKLNKEDIATIGAHTERLTAIIGQLALRLASAESKISAMECLQITPRTPLQVASQPTKSKYAEALKLGRETVRLEPNRMGPTLAFAPADETATQSAEDTKKMLKTAINPTAIGAQVSQVRMISNGRVVVQTTSANAAQRLKDAAPATLRVTELQRRLPLVCIGPLDGDPAFKDITSAIHEQNFREDREWPRQRLEEELKGAFKKNRRGGAATAAIFSCTPAMRHALLHKGKLYIGWQVVEVQDYIAVTCCNKCQQYGHPERHCKAADTTCARCGGSGHRAADCKADTSKCATCHKFGRKEAATHKTAARDCPARLHAESRYTAMTAYDG